MTDRRTLLPALIASLGVFVVTVAFLPRSGSFMFDGEVDYFFKSRTNWSLPFMLAAGAFLFLIGLTGLLRPDKNVDES
jgi:hypothetical protein